MVSERINRCPVVFVQAGSPEGELGKIGFADDVHITSPGRPQAFRVAGRRLICPGQVLRSGSRHLPLHIDDVLYSEAKFAGLVTGWPVRDESVILRGAWPG